MIGPQSFLSYARFRYLKIAGVWVLVATAAYVWDRPIGGASGGTRLGVSLGVLATALILWLMWLGVRTGGAAGPDGLRGRSQ